MKIKNLAIIIALVAAWFGYRHFTAPKLFIANQKPMSGKILAFGDSLTAGYGADEASSYPAVLSRRLQIEILNVGKSGDTMKTAAERLQSEVLSHNPSVVIMTLGGNDVMRQRSLEESEQAAREIFTKLIAAGAMVVFVEIDPPLFAKKRMRAIKKIAEPLGVVWLDGVMTDLWRNSKLMSDNIHPNAAGYKIMAERIQQKLQIVGK